MLRVQQRILRIALAFYLPGGLLFTAGTIWAAIWVARPLAKAVAAAFIGISAVQADYYLVAVIAQLWLAGRDLRRAGSPGGRLTLTGDGMDDGLRLIRWEQVTRVRLRRQGVPHIAVTWRRTTRGRRRTVPIRPAWFKVSLDAMAAAFERYVVVEAKERPRAPVFDEPPGTVTFFVNLLGLRATRRRHVTSAWRLTLLLYPAATGLYAASQPVAAALLWLILVLLVIRQMGKLAKIKRLLRLDHGGLGRLELTADHVTLAGTSVAIPWSHIQDASAGRSDQPGLKGVIACPQHEPDPSCPFRNRTIKFHIGETLYNTTVDDISAAFGRYTAVTTSADG